MMRLIKNPRRRRAAAAALLVLGGVSFLFAPGDALLGLVLAGAGVLLEILGITLRHEDHAA
jgi:energy-converting hydrogenase Eha subunit G